MRRPSLDIQQAVKAGAEAISEVGAIRAEIDQTLKSLIRDGTAARARAGTELSRLQRRIDACLDRCEAHLLPAECAKLRLSSQRMQDVMRELKLRSAVSRRRR